LGLLRFLLAFFVITTHSDPAGVAHPMYASPYVLYVFYAISGYYITLTLTSQYAGPGGIRAYFINRFLRLYPVYFALLLICIPAVFLNENPTRAAWRETAIGSDWWVALTHVTILGQDFTTFFQLKGGGLTFTPAFKDAAFPAWHLLVVPTCWSLAIDCVYYLVAPLFMKRSVAVRVTLAVLSLGWWGVVFAMKLPVDPWIFRVFAGSMVFFLAGSIVRTAHERYRAPIERFAASLRERPARLIATMGPFFAFLIAWRLTGGHEVVRAVRYIVIPMYGVTLLLLPLLFSLSNGASRWCRLDHWLGRVTYPIFIVHYPVIRATRWSNPIAVMGVSLVVSAVVMWVVERAVRRLRITAPAPLAANPS
jgi:peptidoglycan/LPS O-acetylase OafA/YrhL